MKLLVTGGAGFIGSQFVRATLQGDLPSGPGTHVTVLDNLTYSGNPANLAPIADHPHYTFIHGDIRDPDLVDQIVPGHDAIVHFAAESHVDRSITDATPFTTTNILGTQTLLDAAVRHHTGRFHHISTDEVYGSIPHGSWTENTPLNPNSPYSATKAASDLLVHAYHHTHGLDTTITRCTNNYGPYHHPEKLIPLFITTLLNGGTVPLYGDGHNIRDWLHVTDHTQGIDLTLHHAKPGTLYHIGGGTELTNHDLTQLLLDATHTDWTHVRHVPDRKGHDDRYSLNTDKIRNDLGYEPKTPFAQGLTDTVTWYRNNRTWWEPLLTTMTTGQAARTGEAAR